MPGHLRRSILRILVLNPTHEISWSRSGFFSLRGRILRAGPRPPPCFLVFVFSLPPSASEAPGRPLSESSKTLGPAALRLAPARPSRRPSRPPGARRPRWHPLSPRYAAGAPRVALHSARGGPFGRAAATRSLALPHSCTDLCAPSAATRALRSPRTPSRRHLDSRRRRSSRASRAGWSTLTAAWATRAGWRSSGSRGSLGGARCGRCEQAGAVGEARRADASGMPNGRVGVRQASKAGS